MALHDDGTRPQTLNVPGVTGQGFPLDGEVHNQGAKGASHHAGVDQANIRVEPRNHKVELAHKGHRNSGCPQDAAATLRDAHTGRARILKTLLDWPRVRPRDHPDPNLAPGACADQPGEGDFGIRKGLEDPITEACH